MVASAASRGSRPSTKAETTEPSTAQISVQISSICTDRPDRSIASATASAQGGQPGTRDVALVSRYQLLGRSRSGHVPHQQVHQHFGGGFRASAPPRQRSNPRSQLRHFDHPDVLDSARDQIVERREVIRGRRQRQASASGDRPMTHSFEAAFAKQLGGRAHQRIPPAFSFWSNCCSHG